MLVADTKRQDYAKAIAEPVVAVIASRHKPGFVKCSAWIASASDRVRGDVGLHRQVPAGEGAAVTEESVEDGT